MLKYLVVILCLISSTISLSFAHHNISKKNNEIWAKKVINGGYILIVRHGHRDKWVNINAFDLYSIINNEKPETKSYKSSVCLSDKGKEQIKMLNNVFKSLKIKVSHVISSPSCRARQTALLGFDRIDVIDNSVASYMFSNKKELQIKFKKLLLGLNIQSDSNIIISGHGGTLSPNIIDIDEITPKPKIMPFYKFWKQKSNPTSEIGHVGESGFTVLEKKGDLLIAKHTFYNLKNFVEASMSHLHIK